MATYVDVDLQVIGNPSPVPTKADFHITANVTCKRPDTGETYPPALNECTVKLHRVRYLWPDELISYYFCPAGGSTYMGMVSVEADTKYKIEARHEETGNEAAKYILCRPDGSWVETTV